VQHPPGLDLRDPELDVALALALAHLERLLRDRLVREDPYPDLAAALHVAGHRATRRLDLARRQLTPADGLEAVLTEAHRIAAGRKTGVAALELLSEFGSFRLQHGSLCSFRAVRLAPARAAPRRLPVSPRRSRRPRRGRSIPSRRSRRTSCALRRTRSRCPRGTYAKGRGPRDTTPSVRSRHRSAGPTP